MKQKPAHTPIILRLLVSNALSVITLHAQQPAASTETPSSPFSIKNTWMVGGTGSWDYVTMDPAAERLYIAHSRSVQVMWKMDSAA